MVARLALFSAGLALGLVAERASYSWADTSAWIADLAAGLSLIACGLVATSRRPESRSGFLMLTTGFLWFAGNFSGSDVTWLAWLSAHALYLYRGPLVHLVLSYPRGRASRSLDRIAVGIGYAAASVLAVWRSPGATIAFSVGLAAIAAAACLGKIGWERRERLAALQATVLVSLVFAVSAAARLAKPGPHTEKVTLLLVQVSLCVLAMALLAGLIAQPWARAGVADLVVELGAANSGTLRPALARALGDPALEVGYWSAAGGGYINEAGFELTLPAPGSSRSVTVIESGGLPVAAIVHDSVVRDDPELSEAVAVVSHLNADYARLRGEVRDQIAEIEESRRRLLSTGDAERRRLGRRLHDGPLECLARIEMLLAEAREDAGAERELAMRLAQAGEQLELTKLELETLARGLHPRALTELGLGEALGSLAGQLPLPVEVDVADDPLPDETAVSIYFVCAEALTNAAKHAAASEIRVSVRVGGNHVRVEIVDDGLGGADPSVGTGLRGLADRVEALGGTLRVESVSGFGTRLIGEIPVAVGMAATEALGSEARPAATGLQT